MLSRLRLIPRDDRFYDLFRRAAQNNLDGARLLEDILREPADLERRARRLKDIEHQGDEITHEVFRALNRTFVTPLDRDDISRLAGALDDVIDWMEEAARRMRLYRIRETTPLLGRFGRVLVEQAEELAAAVPLLEDLKDPAALERATREVHRLENEADDLFAEAIGGLYDGVAEVPQLIRAMRLGDVYQLLEDATDRAEAAAIAVSNIVVKHG